MTNYHDLSNEEIDKLLAERFRDNIDGSRGYKREVFNGVVVDNWTPTSPDSNQIERYVLPKLRLRALNIHLYYSGGFCIDIYRHTDGINYIAKLGTQEDDQINRTKGICALMAWDKIGAGE